MNARVLVLRTWSGSYVEARLWWRVICGWSAALWAGDARCSSAPLFKRSHVDPVVDAVIVDDEDNS